MVNYIFYKFIIILLIPQYAASILSKPLTADQPKLSVSNLRKISTAASDILATDSYQETPASASSTVTAPAIASRKSLCKLRARYADQQ